ncbi:MAG: hypothetical protein OES47_10770 [Acidobacteriota bacterium]|nr:hypothetical protein [Acidobacteriota bacterium]
MVGIFELWLPILLSAVFVFAASSVFHMVLKFHKKDYDKLPDEDRIMASMREEKVGPGNFSFPHVQDMKDFGSPEVQEKFKNGPVGFMNVLPNGMPNMGACLTQWFVFSIVVGVFVAYLTGRTLDAGTDYLAVFQIAGCVAFMAYGLAEAIASIWKAQRWSTTARHMFDGLVYALLTGGTFGWLWP